MPSSAPHRVAILVTEGLVFMDMAAPVQIFGHACASRYTLTTCAENPGAVRTCAGVSVNVDAGLDALADARTVIVPGYHDAARRTPAPAVVDALRAAHRRGARIASICVGAFTLAEAGLLSGLTVTTHWLDAAALHARYPQVDVDPSVLFVDNGNVLTSAGLAAGIDLCLHMVEQDFGADVALDVARRTVVATRRPGGQAQFVPPDHRAIPSEPQDSESHNGLAAATTWALTHLDQPLTATDLARRASMSLRTFNRHFTEAYGTGPGRWLAGQRILVATRLLERTDQPVDRIAAAVGLSPTALRTQFRNRMSLSPSAYRDNFKLS